MRVLALILFVNFFGFWVHSAPKPRQSITREAALITAEILYFQKTGYFAPPEEKGILASMADDIEFISKNGIRATAQHSLVSLVPEQLSLEIETWMDGVRGYIESAVKSNASHGGDPETLTLPLGAGDIPVVSSIIEAIKAQYPRTKFSAVIRKTNSYPGDSERELQVVVSVDQGSFIAVLREVFRTQVLRVTKYQKSGLEISPPSYFKHVQPIQLLGPKNTDGDLAYAYFIPKSGIKGIQGEGEYVYYTSRKSAAGRTVSKLVPKVLGNPAVCNAVLGTVR